MCRMALMVGVAGVGVGVAAADMHPGAWDGWVAVGESRWPLAVVIDGDGGALLDVDAMGMFRVPAAFTNGDPASLELPFGLGAFELESAGAGAVEGAKDFGGGLVINARLERVGGAPAYTAEDVRFEGDGVELAGTVYLPAGAGGPVPGVVMVHGSSIGHRGVWESRRWVKALLESGVGVLVYDRRGEGASGAGGPDVRFGALSADAVGALRALGAHEGIDRGRLGLMGGSQGAWVAARAADASDLVSFLILTSSPAGTPAEQDREQLEATMRGAGVGAADLEAALAYHELYFRVVRGEAGFDELGEAALAAQDAAWGAYVDQPRSPEDLRWWRDHHDFDMAAALGAVRVPVLALWGGRDTIVPASTNVGAFREALPEGTRATLLVCPDGDHPLERPGFERDAEGRWVWPGLSPLAFGAIERFCREELGGR